MRNFIIEQFYKQRSDFEKSCVEREQKYPLPDGVKCTENIAYAADDKEHRLDVYRLESMEGKVLPIVINVHGGGLLLGNKEFNRGFCALLCKKVSSYTAWNIVWYRTAKSLTSSGMYFLR